MSARIMTTTVGAYDQVVALTQYLINQAFDNVWTNAHQDGDKPQNINHRDGSGMTGTVLGAPSVLIDPQAGDHSLLYYVVKIKAGTLKLFLSADEDDQSTVTYQMNNWRIVFPVNIGLVGTKEPKLTQVRNLINKPGDYTIRTLLVDLQTAQFTAYNGALSSFGTWTSQDTSLDSDGNSQNPPGFNLGQPRDWSNQPDNIQRAFASFMSDMTSKFNAAGLCDLGYTAQQTSLPEGHDPTFIPSDVRFQTYPWVDPSTGQQPSASMTGVGALNYLLYLEMTDKHDPPAPNSDAAFLKASNGNWTDGKDPKTDSPSAFGSMVISGRNFLDAYFLPKMYKVNRTLVSSVTSITPYIKQVSWVFKYEYCFNYTLSVGTGVSDYHQPQSDDVNFAFTKGSSATWGKFDPLPAGTLEWIYSHEDTGLNKGDDSGIEGSKSSMSSDGKAGTWIRLYIKLGTNKIVLEAISTVHLHWEVDPNALDHNFGKTMDVTTKWTITFTLTAVSDGGLAIAIDTQGGTPTISGDIWDSSDSDRINGPYAQATSNLQFLMSKINDALKGQERFYFPSKGTFFLKDAVFNHEGDLITGLEYNGNDNDPTPNQGAATRQSQSIDLNGKSFQALQPLTSDNAVTHP